MKNLIQKYGIIPILPSDAMKKRGVLTMFIVFRVVLLSKDSDCCEKT